MSSARSLHQTLRFAFQLKACVLISLAARERCNSLHESKILSGLRRSSHRTVSMIFAASDLEKPPRRRIAWQSSSVQATIRFPARVRYACHKYGRRRIGKARQCWRAASCAHRCAANYEWRIAISSRFSTPQRLRFLQIETRNPQRLAAHLSISTIAAEPGDLLKKTGRAHRRPPKSPVKRCEALRSS
ncbi:hypothetical protein J2R87_001924 [Bradyrhizobium elkanii]|nr:hypothetical protein [Bradyrhizobium elkanii]MCS4110315.1 hypothetical protein [Bradyrhizobium elkanii]